MSWFNLKRHHVRDALRQLNAMALVVRVPNRGAFVPELTPKEAIEIYEIREILEVAAAQRTSSPAPEEVTEALRVIQESIPRPSQKMICAVFSG
jgi:DNA-binding GntR family transcriptional regulator